VAFDVVEVAGVGAGELGFMPWASNLPVSRLIANT
jgi:hypothetical protein